MLFANILIHIELHCEHRSMVQPVVEPLICLFFRQILFTIYYQGHLEIVAYHL